MKLASIKTLNAAVNAIRRNRQHGTSLLEALAYLGIAALVILGAISLLSGAFSGANSNKAEQEVSAIRTGVKKLFVGQSGGYGTGNLNATLVTAKVFPQSMTVSGSTVTNTFGGAATVTGNGSLFQLAYNAVPQDICVNLIVGSTEWSAISVNGGSDLTPPVSASQASTACNVTSSTGNAIVFSGN